MQNHVIFVKKESRKSSLKVCIIRKLEIIATIQVIYRGGVHSKCNSKFNVPNEIPVVFHSVSNYDYQIWINENLDILEKIQKSKKLFQLQ